MSQDANVFDTFSTSQNDQCHVVTVKVIRGSNITKSKFYQLFGTPHPYVRLQVPESRSLLRSTKACRNNANPEWNETFQFIINPRIKNTLYIELRESDYINDDFIAKQVYDLDNVPLDVTTKVTVTFGENTTVDLELTKTLSEKSDIRLGLTLCDEEEKFVNERKQKVFKAMQEAFGAEGPQNLDEVPVIGVMGSGGGFRAMTGFCGVLSALSETGVFDMTTYLAGLSGSTWYMGHLYSHPEWPNKTPTQLQGDLKNSITKPWFKKLSFSLIQRMRKLYLEKRSRPQPVSLTDFFGMLVGEILLGREMEGRLSDQTKKIEKADLPLPIYTAIRVKPSVVEDKFSEWMEFSPYEISMPKYGVSLQPQLFNSKFHLARLEEKYPEPNLHFLLGVFGSAYAIHLKRLIRGHVEDSEQEDEEYDSLDGRALKGVQQSQSDAGVQYSGVGQAHLEMKTHPVQNAEPENEDSDESDDEEEEALKWLAELDEDEDSDKLVENAEPDNKGYDIIDGGVLKSAGLKGLKILKWLLGSKAFNSRKNRAAKVLNFCFGLDAPAYYGSSNCEDETDGVKDKKLAVRRSLYIVDAGLSINLPTPPLLRPQRHIDLIISFDFSAREDGDCPLKELRKSEKWAKENGVRFPPISISRETVGEEGVKECYVFKDPEDDLCPIVVHFMLVNDTFKTFKSPGEPRVTPEEKKFGDFSVFDDDAQPYSTMNFTYTNESFERIVQLMSYNTLNHKEEIFDAIKECSSRRKQRAQDTGVAWYIQTLFSRAANNIRKLLKCGGHG